MARQPIKNQLNGIIGYKEEQPDGTIRFYNKLNNFVGSQAKNGQLRNKIGTPTTKHPFWSQV